MKKVIGSTISFLKKYEILNIDPSIRSLLFLATFMIIGMICGTLIVPSLNMESLYKLDFLFLSDFKQRLEQSNIQVFMSSFYALSLFALFIELSALSCWGIIVIPAILTFKGLGLGLTAGYLYLIYGLKGIAFYILILLPGIFVSSIGLTLFSLGSMKFSFKLLKTIFHKKNSAVLLLNIKEHFKASSYCLVVLGISSLIDVGFMAMFSKFFNF